MNISFFFIKKWVQGCKNRKKFIFAPKISKLFTKTIKKMAFKIEPEICTACGACKDECPVDAIVAGDVYHIEEDVCIDCGACESTCPSNAIHD